MFKVYNNERNNIIGIIFEMVAIILGAICLNICSCGVVGTLLPWAGWAIALLSIADIFIYIIMWGSDTSKKTIVTTIISSWIRPIVLFVLYAAVANVKVNAITILATEVITILAALVITIVGVIKAKKANGTVVQEKVVAAVERVQEAKVRQMEKDLSKTKNFSQISSVEEEGVKGIEDATKALQDLTAELKGRSNGEDN